MNNLDWHTCETSGQQYAIGKNSQTYWVDDDGNAVYVLADEIEPIELAQVGKIEIAKQACEAHNYVTLS